MPNNTININLNEALTKKITIHENLGQDIIITTTDKVKLILADHHEIIKKKSEWITPVGLFISVLATILTATFTDVRFGLEPEIWQAIFYLFCFVSFLWSCIVGYNAWKYSNEGTVEQFIEDLKIDNHTS